MYAAPLKRKRIIPETKTEGSEGVGTNNVNGKQEKRTTSVFDKSSCCHIPSPHEIQPNVCQVKDILLFHGVLLAKTASLLFSVFNLGLSPLSRQPPNIPCQHLSACDKKTMQLKNKQTKIMAVLAVQ